MSPWASVSSSPEQGLTCALQDHRPQRVLPRGETWHGEETDQEEQERRGVFCKEEMCGYKIARRRKAELRAGAQTQRSFGQ